MSPANPFRHFLNSTHPGFGIRVVLRLLLVLVTLPLSASAAEFTVSPDAEENLIVFESHAPLESFEGKTNSVSGAIGFDPESLTDSLEIYLEVDLASLDTGIDRRNRHMRENHLHTDKYPTAVFRGAKLEAPLQPLVSGETAKLSGRGRFELHGVTREDFAFNADLTLKESENGTTLVVQAKFEVNLADFEIPRPKFLFVKLNETQLVTVNLIGHLNTK